MLSKLNINIFVKEHAIGFHG